MKYTAPEIEMAEFDTVDVITVSGGGGTTPPGGGTTNPDGDYTLPEDALPPG